ncbi:hypothetical protein LTR36_005387 [Oleoguttula mirabilis]|uniref:N-terminal nucleophile aminohydrolase n=1 Tax=Oleoguttula mirabilis TaxID=1507867 RepID=A0AAV9JF10_9PEZI|nr:hypothetical protein LTR36_005387 [Oleoguttula mirabilis]
MFNSKRGRKPGDIACIFVHAGAGYHSVQNEQHHLAACNDAAKAAMAIMRNGGSAVDAVEISIKILEDREITNAGYGSNLAMDGVVECDAVVVDQYGRSGGAGAVAQIKNPISLARLLLDHTTQTLSLRRVPPNLLVGQGATDFAYDHHMPVLPLDCLVSPAARDRWRRWKSDLIRAEANKRREDAERYGLSPSPSDHDLTTFLQDQAAQENMRQVHTKAMMAGMWNEAQPVSPPPSDDKQEMDLDSAPPSCTNSSLSMRDDDTSETTPDATEESFDPYGPPGMLAGTSKNPFAKTTEEVVPAGSSRDSAQPGRADGGVFLHRQYGSHLDLSDMAEPEHDPLSHVRQSSHVAVWNDGSSGSNSNSASAAFQGRSHPSGRTQQSNADAAYAAYSSLPGTPDGEKSTTPQTSNRGTPRMPPSRLPLHDGAQIDEDVVTDTVGAVAIDMYGNIACGASSGGIGMKHRGRIGPAALVGIGAAVIPIDADDPDRTCVATVTSGTGEHMGTTQAASVCSERLYHNLRKGHGGHYEQAGDDEIIKAFIEKDFMGHPSVKQSHSAGAIGMLTVKKSKDGVYLYFGHNTDSFALASMHADESRPVCTMSRSKGGGVIAQGGRAIRFKRKRSA